MLRVISVASLHVISRHCLVFTSFHCFHLSSVRFWALLTAHVLVLGVAPGARYLLWRLQISHPRGITYGDLAGEIVGPFGKNLVFIFIYTAFFGNMAILLLTCSDALAEMMFVAALFFSKIFETDCHVAKWEPEAKISDCVCFVQSQCCRVQWQVRSAGHLSHCLHSDNGSGFAAGVPIAIAARSQFYCRVLRRLYFCCGRNHPWSNLHLSRHSRWKCQSHEAKYATCVLH